MSSCLAISLLDNTFDAVGLVDESADGGLVHVVDGISQFLHTLDESVGDADYIVLVLYENRSPHVGITLGKPGSGRKTA